MSLKHTEEDPSFPRLAALAVEPRAVAPDAPRVVWLRRGWIVARMVAKGDLATLAGRLRERSGRWFGLRAR